MLAPSVAENREKTDEFIYFQWISSVFWIKWLYCILLMILLLMMIESIDALPVSSKFVTWVSTSYISNAHVFRHFESADYHMIWWCVVMLGVNVVQHFLQPLWSFFVKCVVFRMVGCQDATDDGVQGDLPAERSGTAKVVNAQILARGYTKGLLLY